MNIALVTKFNLWNVLYTHNSAWAHLQKYRIQILLTQLEWRILFPAVMSSELKPCLCVTSKDKNNWRHSKKPLK